MGYVDAMDNTVLIVGGDFSADGQTFVATSSWDLRVDGSATAANVNVQYSNAGGFSTIFTDLASTNSGNNVNWAFALVPSPNFQIPISWTRQISQNGVLSIDWRNAPTIAGTWVLGIRGGTWILQARSTEWILDERGTTWTLGKR